MGTAGAVAGRATGPPPTRTGVEVPAIVFRALAIAVFALVWEVGARSLPEGLLPGPARVAQQFLANLADGDTYFQVLVTLKRVLIGFAVSFALGTVIGVAMALSRIAAGLFKPWVMVGLAIPGPLAAIIGVLFFGLSEVGALAALVSVVFPFVVIPVWNGARGADPRLFQMAQVFRVAGWEMIRAVVIPQIMPSIIAGGRVGFALAWKLVVIIESISQQDGVGRQLYNAFQFVNMSKVIAWMLAFSLVMLAIEAFVLRPSERYLLRWRRDAAL